MTSLPTTLPAFLWLLMRARWGVLSCLFLGYVLGALINSALGPYYLKLVVDAADSAFNKRDPGGQGILWPAVGYAALFVAAALTYRSMGRGEGTMPACGQCRRADFWRMRLDR
jgi:hypothetical protein